MARIIIVEADELVADIAIEALAAAGHMISAVHDGAQALAAIGTGAPDVLILDHDLPGRTGLDILRQVRMMPAGDAVLVLMLTGYSSRLMKARAEHGGADDFIVKPFRPDDLVVRVEALLTGRSIARGAERP